MMILVVDGNGLVHTLFHITESRDPADVVERFLNRLEYLQDWAQGVAVKVNEPLKLICCFDSPGCFRFQLIKEYKAHRTKDPLATESVKHAFEALINSSDWVAALSPAMYEADDLIASIAHQVEEKVVIHSSDKDFNQCLVHGRVGIVKRSGVFEGAEGSLSSLSVAAPALEVKQYTYRSFVDEFGFGPERFVDYQCLVGDSADNVKGAVGVGPVAAKKIIRDGQIEAYDHERLNSRQRENWPTFMTNLSLLRSVFTLEKELRVAEWV